MINADRDITIFNVRYDADNRQESFIPTTISGVSLYDVRAIGGDGSSREETSDVKIRIPFEARIQDDRDYIPEEAYTALSDEDALKYWTLQKGCYILRGGLVNSDDWVWDDFSFRGGVITKERLTEIRAYDGTFITVTEYADNTHRGSKAVWHWRVGGKL